jgi:integrase
MKSAVKLWSGKTVQLIQYRGKPHTIWYEGERRVLRVAKGNNFEEQKEIAKKIDAEINQGVYISKSRTFEKVCENFDVESFSQVKRQRLDKPGRKISQGRYVELTGHIKNHLLKVKLPLGSLKNMHMKDIDAATVVQIRAELAKYLKGQTANKILNTLNRVCVFAIENGDMKTNPVRDVDPLPTESKRDDYTPTAEEVSRVIEHALPRYQPIIKIAAMTGLRVGELVSLEWGDIEENVLTVQRAAHRYLVKSTKTENGVRKLRLSQQARQTLCEWKDKAPKSKYVFPTTTGKLDSQENWRSRGLHPACVRANVKKFGWHGLRRFYINSLLDAGAPKDHVQKLVGHAVGSHVTDAHYRRIRDEDVLQDDLTVSL